MMCKASGRGVRPVVLLSTILGLFCWGPASAAITVTGDVNPPYDYSDPWILADDLIVGDTADANVVVSGGSRVWIDNAYATTMAMNAGSTATVTITGKDSSWTSMASTVVGHQGHADLVVSDGGQFYCDLITDIGEGGIGSVLVTGSGSTLTGSVCRVAGDNGQGTMTIADGGLAGHQEAWVGTGAGTLGEVSVAGQGSLWEVDFGLAIGYYGDGRLTISDGGEVTDTRGYLGSQSNSAGTAVVTGPGSIWRSSFRLYIGGDENQAGGTASLGIYDQGLVDGNSVTIWPTGTVTGDGTLRGKEVINYGTLRPGGASIGTLVVDSNLTLQNSSMLEIKIDNEGNGDKLAVTGVAALAGQVKAIPVETITGSRQYTVVEANSVSGEFEALDTALLDLDLLLRGAGLEYDSDSVLLTITEKPFDDPNIVRTANQRSLGSVLQQVAETGGNGITTALQQLQTEAEVRHAYDQLSGQTRAPLGSVAAAGVERHLTMVSHRLHRAAGAFTSDSGVLGLSGRGTLALAGPEFGINSAADFSTAASPLLFALGNGTSYLADQPWGVWGRGYALHGSRDTTAEIPGYAYATYGTTFGLDYRFTDQLLLGVVGGLSKTDTDYARSCDSADTEATYYGLYGSYETSQWYCDGILSYGDLDFDTRRYVDVIGARLDGDCGGNAISGYFEGGFAYRLTPEWLLQPLASFQFAIVKTDDLTESPGDAGLSFNGDRFESYKGSLGAREIGLLFKNADGSQATLELRGRWLHEFGDTRSSINTHFVNDPEFVFTVTDAEAPKDSAQLGIGFDLWFGKALRTFFDYDWEGNHDLSVNLFSAGLQYRW